MKSKSAEKDAEIAALKKENAKLRHAEVWKLVEQNERQGQTIKQLLDETSELKAQLTSRIQLDNADTFHENVDGQKDSRTASKARAGAHDEVGTLREQNNLLTADVAMLRTDLATANERHASLEEQYRSLQHKLAADMQTKLDTSNELESIRRNLEKTAESNEHTQECLNLAHKYIFELQGSNGKARGSDYPQKFLDATHKMIRNLQQEQLNGTLQSSGKVGNASPPRKIRVVGTMLDNLTHGIATQVQDRIATSDAHMQEVLRLKDALEAIKSGKQPPRPPLDHALNLSVSDTTTKGIPVPKTAEEQLLSELIHHHASSMDAKVMHRFISDTITHIEGNADGQRHRAVSPRRQIQLAQAFKRYSSTGRFADKPLPVPVPSVPEPGTDGVVSHAGNTPAEKEKWFQDAIYEDSMSDSADSLDDLMRDVEAADLAFAAVKANFQHAMYKDPTSDSADSSSKDPLPVVRVRDFAASKADSAYASEKDVPVENQVLSTPNPNSGSVKPVTAPSAPSKSAKLTREEIQIKVKQRTEAARRMALIAKQDKEVERRRKLRFQNLAKVHERKRPSGWEESISIEVENQFAEHASKKQKKHAGTGAPEPGELLPQPGAENELPQTKEQLQIYEDK
ncbi:uncharacterized protein AB675_9180 [Cyphellophora attinorum]|uniref:Uncharacterized protein n=1 Tax=Cyphellophora attinorum TaxID=1664694 RepID=A0A0N1HCS6_9EURO|nr:uncharacterized protein AB675_9180 [Phialophora attinorum]KPI41762.1 hypothetical protein AB675_9180 [Phialophora attinorum]